MCTRVYITATAVESANDVVECEFGVAELTRSGPFNPYTDPLPPRTMDRARYGPSCGSRLITAHSAPLC